MDTADDKDFILEEIRNAIESIGNKKAPEEDGITGEIYKSSFEKFPNYITAMYNECLRKGVFQKKVEKSKTDTNYKTWEKTAKTFLNFTN